MLEYLVIIFFIELVNPKQLMHARQQKRVENITIKNIIAIMYTNIDSDV